MQRYAKQRVNSVLKSWIRDVVEHIGSDWALL
jgi:hypothetical protein